MRRVASVDCILCNAAEVEDAHAWREAHKIAGRREGDVVVWEGEVVVGEGGGVVGR